MTPEPIQVTDPRALLLPDFADLVLAALRTSPLVERPEEALIEMAQCIGKEPFGLFTVREAGEFVAVMIAENNSSELSPGCMVLHFYNKGSAEARKALLDALAGFARSGGHRKIWGIDINQRPKGFARLFKALGPAQLRGQLYGFDTSEGSE